MEFGMFCFFWGGFFLLKCDKTVLPPQQEQRTLGHLLVVMSLWAQKVASYLLDGVLWSSIAEPNHHNLLSTFSQECLLCFAVSELPLCVSLCAILHISLHYTREFFIHRQISRCFKLMLVVLTSLEEEIWTLRSSTTWLYAFRWSLLLGSYWYIHIHEHWFTKSWNPKKTYFYK